LLPCLVDVLHKLPEKTLWDLFVTKLLTGQLQAFQEKQRANERKSADQQSVYAVNFGIPWTES
jgi:hypothetical protein